MCLCVSICMCHVSVFVCLYICDCMCVLCLCLCVYLCLFICVYVRPSVVSCHASMETSGLRALENKVSLTWVRPSVWIAESGGKGKWFPKLGCQSTHMGSRDSFIRLPSGDSPTGDPGKVRAGGIHSVAFEGDTVLSPEGTGWF